MAPPDPTITGPSNTGPDPVVTLGPVATPFVRTGIQGSVAIGAVRLLTVLPNPDLTISEGDRDLIILALTGAICWVQNMAEKIAGRRLIGAPR